MEVDAKTAAYFAKNPQAVVVITRRYYDLSDTRPNPVPKLPVRKVMKAVVRLRDGAPMYTEKVVIAGDEAAKYLFSEASKVSTDPLVSVAVAAHELGLKPVLKDICKGFECTAKFHEGEPLWEGVIKLCSWHGCVKHTNVGTISRTEIRNLQDSIRLALDLPMKD